MKSLRLMLALVLVTGGTVALAQSNEHKHGASDQQAPAAKPAPTPAQQSFAILKGLAGSWDGVVTMTPPMDGAGDAHLDVSLRVTSRGNAIVHEMHESGKPDDPTKYDHPLTMLYLDGGQLMLTHYCDAGNRPRMTARPSADGKTVEFDFVDVAGPVKYGNMYHAVFTTIDENHHVEEWTFKLPGDKLMKARMELQRKSVAGAASGK